MVKVGSYFDVFSARMFQLLLSLVEVRYITLFETQTDYSLNNIQEVFSEGYSSTSFSNVPTFNFLV